MRKTIKQLEQELTAAKHEAAMWKEAHAAALKALVDHRPFYLPSWYQTGQVAPLPYYTWGTITCSDGTLTGSTSIPGATVSIGEVKAES